MKLSLWHCQAFYVLTKLKLDEVAKIGEVSLSLLVETARSENWSFKKEKYAKLDAVKKYDLDIIELLLGDFKSNDAHLKYVQAILVKLKAKEAKTKEDIKQQYINQLGEFGMTKEQANSFIADMQKKLGEGMTESEFVAPLVDDAEVSIKEKIDTINAGYNFLVRAQSQGASEMHDALRRHCKFYSDMMDQLHRDLPTNMSWEDLAAYQRALSYTSASYKNLAALLYQVSGVKAHVNEQSSISALFGKGYMVMRRDELGRLAGDGN